LRRWRWTPPASRWARMAFQLFTTCVGGSTSRPPAPPARARDLGAVALGLGERREHRGDARDVAELEHPAHAGLLGDDELERLAARLQVAREREDDLDAGAVEVARVGEVEDQAAHR